MRNKDFAVLARRLLPGLPGFAIKAPLMFILPIGYTLRGLYFESHSYDKKLFYVWVFFLPLFIPRKHVSFEFGKRIGGDRWNADAPDLIQELGDALKREALPFLSVIKSPWDVAQAAMALRLPQNQHIQQAIAYALARAGEVNTALRALHELIRLLDARVPWQREMAERAETLIGKLAVNPADAQKQLETWEAETVKNLGLDSFRQKQIP